MSELGITDTVIYSVAFSPARNEVLGDLAHSNDAYYEDESKPPPKKKPPADPAKDDDAPVQPMTSAEKAPFFAYLPPEITLTMNALKKNAASELAALSGGEYVNFTTRKGFEQSLYRISNEIHNYYVLSFKPSDSAGGLHSLRVRVPDYPDARIQTRKNYWAESRTQR